MNIAENFAELSHCERQKNGAVLVKDGRIISSGYNGTPSGSHNKCEDKNGNTKPNVIHAEINSILFCARNGVSSIGCDMFCTTSPCQTCATAIIQAGIENVYFKNYYRDDEGIRLLINAGIGVYFVNGNEVKNIY